MKKKNEVPIWILIIALFFTIFAMFVFAIGAIKSINYIDKYLQDQAPKISDSPNRYKADTCGDHEIIVKENGDVYISRNPIKCNRTIECVIK